MFLEVARISTEFCDKVWAVIRESKRLDLDDVLIELRLVAYIAYQTENFDSIVTREDDLK